MRLCGIEAPQDYLRCCGTSVLRRGKTLEDRFKNDFSLGDATEQRQVSPDKIRSAEVFRTWPLEKSRRVALGPGSYGAAFGRSKRRVGAVEIFREDSAQTV